MPSQNFIIGVFRGASPDIMNIKLGFLNLKIYSVYSEEFKRLLKRIKPNDKDRHFNDYEHLFNENGGVEESLYAFVPIRKDKPAKENVFYSLQTILLIMFPSNFKLVGLMNYFDRQAKGIYNNVYFITHRYNVLPVNGHSDYYDLTTQIGKINDINTFLKLFFAREEGLNYLDVTFSSYVQAFTHMDLKMAYTNYFMALDSLTDDTKDTTHRISRICAVLNSEDKETGRTIYKNYASFYSLRSAIVHGGKPKKMEEYYFNVQALISTTLMELIIMNFSSKEEFNRTIIASGFGEKSKLAARYRQFKINRETKEIIATPVAKYK